MNKKRKRLLLGIFLLIVAAVAIMMFQIYHAMHIKRVYAWMSPIEQLSLEEKIEYLSDDKDSYQYFTDENRFPSDRAEDYCYITLYADVRNCSILPAKATSFYLKEDLPKARICYVMDKAEFSGPIKGYDTRKKEHCLTLIIYRNGCSDEEIYEQLASLDIEIYYHNAVTSRMSLYEMKEAELDILDGNPYE